MERHFIVDISTGKEEAISAEYESPEGNSNVSENDQPAYSQVAFRTTCISLPLFQILFAHFYTSVSMK